MDINRVQARWALGLLRDQDLPEVAAEALRSGYRGPCLEDLAEMDPRALPEGIFDCALREMGRKPITAIEAVRRLARDAALRILRRQTPPRAGAEEIARALRRFDWEDVPTRLREFRWDPEDRSRGRTLTDEHRIVELAWELLEE